MSSDFHLLLDLRVSTLLPAIWDLGALFRQPNGSETDEVGREEGEQFLELQGIARADFQVVDFEDLFAFAVGSFNGLAGIVIVKPGW